MRVSSEERGASEDEAQEVGVDILGRLKDIYLLELLERSGVQVRICAQPQDSDGWMPGPAISLRVLWKVLCVLKGLIQIGLCKWLLGMRVEFE